MDNVFPNKSFLVNKIEGPKDSFQEKATERWKRGFSSSLTIAIVAAVNSILLGINISTQMDSYIKIISLVLSAFISVVNFYIGFNKDKQLMVTYNDTVNRLKSLELRIDFDTRTVDLTDEQAKNYLVELQSIFDTTNANWSHLSKQ